MDERLAHCGVTYGSTGASLPLIIFSYIFFLYGVIFINIFLLFYNILGLAIDLRLFYLLISFNNIYYITSSKHLSYTAVRPDETNLAERDIILSKT